MYFRITSLRKVLIAVLLALAACLIAPGSGAQIHRMRSNFESANRGYKVVVPRERLQQSNSGIASRDITSAELKPDLKRALATRAEASGASRKNGYQPANIRDAKDARPRIFAKQSTRP